MAVDLATLVAAIALWALIQGGIFLVRWNRLRDGEELLWFGAGFVAVGVGAGLMGARYFGLPYLLTNVAANILLLTGTSLFIQGTRAVDGLRPVPLLIVAPGALWAIASMSGSFRADPHMAVRLYSVLSVTLVGVAGAQLIRGGTTLWGRRIRLGLWAFVATAMIIRIVHVDEMIPGLRDRYAATTWHVIFLSMSAASIVSIGYINLALSESIERLGAFTRALEHSLSTLTARGRLPPQALPQERAFLWSLRIDRLLFERAPVGEFGDVDIRDIAQGIVACCPGIVALRRVGADRLIWWTAAGAGDAAGQLHKLTETLACIAARPTFPGIPMSCGVAPVSGNDLADAATADRRARIIRVGAQPWRTAPDGGSPVGQPERDPVL